MFRTAKKMPRLRSITWMDTFADGQDWGVDYPAGTASAFKPGK